MAIAASLLCGWTSINSDLAVAEAKFHDRISKIHQSTAERVGIVDAVLRAAGELQSEAAAPQTLAMFVDKLLTNYDFLASILQITADPRPANTSDDILRIVAMRPERAYLERFIGEDALRLEPVRHSMAEAIESGRTVASGLLANDTGGVGFLAIQAVFAPENIAPASGGGKTLQGAVALFLDGERFFAAEGSGIDALSFWMYDPNAQVGSHRPLYERRRPVEPMWALSLIAPFKAANQLDAFERKFWISAERRPTLADITLRDVMLAAIAPWLAACAIAFGLGKFRRARTQAREFEGKLTQSEQRFKDFADASVDWYWEMDSELRFSYFSDRFADITGVSQETLLGKTRRETGIPDVDPGEWERHLTALDTRAPFRDFTHPRTMDDGRTVWLSINGKPIYGHDGAFLGFRGTGRDITAQVKRKGDLEDAIVAAEMANRAKSEFLANMSHELRTPLNAVIGFSKILGGEDAARFSEAERQEFGRHIHDSGDHLLNLINDLLDLSKIEAGKDELRSEPTDLPGLLKSIQTMMTPHSSDAGVGFKVEGPDPAWPLQADRRKLLQILANLLSNAFKFTPRGGAVSLVCRFDAAGGCAFDIADTGIGIAPEDLPKAFAKFGQIENDHARSYAGTGLGLSLTKLLVEQHGGVIGVESKVGAGTTFTVSLPPERTLTDMDAKALAG